MEDEQVKFDLMNQVKFLNAQLTTYKQMVKEVVDANAIHGANIFLLQDALKEVVNEKAILENQIVDSKNLVAELQKKISDDAVAQEAAKIAEEIAAKNPDEEGLAPNDYVPQGQ